MARTPIIRDANEARKVKKEKSREKEYRRSQNINTAFDSLQQRIPYLRQEERKSLPKIKTLRLAMQYIAHLNKLLDGNELAETESNESRPLTHSDFRNTVTNEMRIRNSYRERAHSQEMDQETVQRILTREENRRRCISMPDERGYISNQQRQFGPISNNVYNLRHQIDENYMPFQNPMMMMVPYNTQVINIENHVNYHPMPMDISHQYMLDSNYSTHL
uniref:BHLH domain-containing protein n=1 Tax=Caenorhabditis tropicalis TaxID=1561998 RepID=A0A1I7UF42_9PELO